MLPSCGLRLEFFKRNTDAKLNTRRIIFKLQKIKDKKISKEIRQEEKNLYLLRNKDKNYVRLLIRNHTYKKTIYNWTIYNCKKCQNKFFRDKENNIGEKLKST